MKQDSFAPNPFPEHKLPARTRWDGRYAQFDNQDMTMAAPLLRQWLPSLPRTGRGLDIAAGAGRHSIALAQHGLQVDAVDISWVGLRLLKQRAAPTLRLTPIVLDLALGHLPRRQYQVILNFFYLERAVWPAIRRQLTPGGWFICETYTVEQLTLSHKRPLRRAFLLERGELRRAFDFLEIIHYEEGIHAGRATARLVGRQPI